VETSGERNYKLFFSLPWLKIYAYNKEDFSVRLLKFQIVSDSLVFYYYESDPILRAFSEIIPGILVSP